MNINGKCSECVEVTSGVPQGSVLGPTLFIFFINDMPDVVCSTIKIFADDTKVYTGTTSLENTENLQISIDNLLNWSDDWQIKFNTDKCKVLHIGKENPCRTYCMKDIVLEETASEKDLGVIMDEDLKFDEHIIMSVKKANKLVGLISHHIVNKTKEVMGNNQRG